MKHIGISYNEP